jgi:hypothetical protein
MCFVYDGAADVYRETWQRARKDHWCDGCYGKTIAKGDAYRASASLFDGSWQSWKSCEKCIYLQACIYACERADGCGAQESLYPIEEVRSSAVERGLWSADLTAWHEANEARAKQRLAEWRAKKEVP